MYTAEVQLGGAKNVSVSVGVSSPATGGATVKNSTNTFNQTLTPGQVYTLPNINHTDSTGSTVSTPGQVPFVATPVSPAAVRNSDLSYDTTVAAGGTLILPDITIFESDGITSLYTVPAVQDYTLSGVSVTDGGGSVTLEDGDTYTATTILKVFFDAGEAQVDVVIDADSAATYTTESQDGASGTISYSIDTGVGFGAATLPFTVAATDTLRITRTSTGASGFVRLSS